MKPFKKNYRYPWEVIKKALTMYHKSDSISFREVSKKLEKEGIFVSYKTIYDWNRKLGEEYDTKLNELQDMIKK